MSGVLGPFPPRVLARGKETIKYFTLSNIVYEKSPVRYAMPCHAMMYLQQQHTSAFNTQNNPKQRYVISR